MNEETGQASQQYPPSSVVPQQVPPPNPIPQQFLPPSPQYRQPTQYPQYIQVSQGVPQGDKQRKHLVLWVVITAVVALLIGIALGWQLHIEYIRQELLNAFGW